MAIEIGQHLLHYRIAGKIGQGGMGEVYVAEDTRLQRRVALKVLPQAVAADADRRTRFEREARVLAGLNHPNIVTLHSVEEADGVHFITMELVEGKTLRDLLPRHGFSFNRLLEIAIPLADAVSRAHREGITHRDLKPDNIMIDGEGRLRVLDFGLAKLHAASPDEGSTQAKTVSAVTEEGKILGTVAYMSPEQAEGKEVDPRSDVFSLGTILYEMITGLRPFRGDTKMSTMGAILKDEPVSIIELKPVLPRHLGRVIRRCLAKDPDRRYQTALELRNELEDLKSEIDSGAHMAAAARPGRALWPWALASMVAVLAVAAVFVLMAWRQPAPALSRFSTRPITSTIEQEGDVNWSPESEFMAFSRIRGGSADVMVQPLSGGPAVVRASGPGDETVPRWSPDGKYLAYISSADPGTFIYLMPPHGGTPSKLIATNFPTLDIESLNSSMGDRPWSPDSKTLLVSRVGDDGRVAVYSVNRKSGEASALTSPPAGSADFNPSYSFSGERIVFQRRRYGKGKLMIMASAGGEAEVLLADDADNLMPAWRPDDRHVVFRSNRAGGGPNLWEIDVSTGSLRQLTAETNKVVSFSISADDRIAYTPYWHDTFLFVVDAATGERRQITSHTKDNFGARFSPDGTTIAYHSTLTGNSEIWLHYLDGRPETRITDDASWDLYADWSPDGRHLLFVSDREGGEFKIFIANSDGGGVRRLMDRAISVNSTWAAVNGVLVSRWSPDGGQIAFLVSGEESNALWTIQADGENARERLKDVTDFDWYRDDRHAIFTRAHGSAHRLLAVDLETGREQLLFEGPIMEMDVAPDGSAVAFCHGRGHMGMGLAVLKLAAPSEPEDLPRALGEPEYLVPVEGTWHVHNGGWSADSRQLVYTRDLDYGDVFELVEKK
ncbi:MAG: protein kinase [Acidobacteria bacterium]|nr:protein kinase [Acidobacteriota bacterium]